MSLPAEDLEYLIRDSGGVAVTIGATATWGHVDAADTEVGEKLETRAEVVMITIPTSKAGGVRNGMTISVAGVNHKVKEHGRQRDTALTDIYAVKA